MILPFMEQAPLYDQLNLNILYYSSPNNTLKNTKIPSYQCPSDNAWLGAESGVNYVVSAGPTTFWRIPLGEQLGMFNYRRTVSFRDLKDGSSNVIAASEALHGDNNSTYHPQQDLVRGTAFPSGFARVFTTKASLDAYGVTCRANGAPGGSATHSHTHREWLNGIGCQTVFNTLNTPNSDNPDCHPCTGCGWYDSQGVWSARSRHTGGVQVLMGDGSVHFISENVDMRTWQNLGHIQDGNPVGEY